jgi:N-acetyl-gamma-glutamyl-phosphate reductase
MIKVSIVGSTGYVGIELMRLLQQHPEVEIKDLISKSSAGEKLVDIYPQFRGSKLEDYNLQAIEDFEPENSDLIFTALPHGVSQDITTELVGRGAKIIDMSGDFRYHDLEIYEKWYGVKHRHPEVARKAVYGLVELNREKIKKAELIANPGCYVTASLLGLLPIVKNSMADLSSIIIDAKSGVSGAGKSLKSSLLFTETHNTLKAYSPAVHRHSSEIEYILNKYLSGRFNLKDTDNKKIKNNKVISNLNNTAEVLFTPHLVPIKRGILSTIYLNLNTKSSQEEINEIYKNFYENENFVQILENELPEIKNVAGSNYTQIACKYDERTNRLIIVSVLDNMIKGASGQAVQNMNLLFGFPEDMGLKSTALFP